VESGRRTRSSGQGSDCGGPKWLAPPCLESSRVQLKRRVFARRGGDYNEVIVCIIRMISRDSSLTQLATLARQAQGESSSVSARCEVMNREPGGRLAACYGDFVSSKFSEIYENLLRLPDWKNRFFTRFRHTSALCSF